MPFPRGIETLGAPLIYDSGDYAKLLTKAEKAIGWMRLRSDLEKRRTMGETVGAGVAMFVEESGSIASETVRATLKPDGSIEIVTGAASVGQGIETVIAQICADALGIDYRRVQVVHGQTDRIARGLGTYGSRVTMMTGEASRLAASELRATIMSVAAMLLQTKLDSLEVTDGRVVNKTKGHASVTFAEVARAVSSNKSQFNEHDALVAEGTFDSRQMSYPYGLHCAIVRIDRETGSTAVERYLVAYDVGKAVNPMLIEGQMVGGVVQGIGGALFEEFLYDARGEPLSVSLDSYLMPTVRDCPSIEVLLTEDAPSPTNPLGIKGAGEGGANAVGAAIAAAIDDALGRPGAVTQLPVTPLRLRKILQR